ncbi:DUF4224 domain-containing protein [Salmonella enterica]|nr:DUF4224 domain-containing protein [Salmonella enterica]
MTALTLTPEEIQEITGYARYTRQQLQLRYMGIPFTTGKRNRPIVLRKHFDTQIPVISKVNNYVASEPDFSAING